MEMVLNGKNLYVVNKIPGKLEKLEVLSDEILLQGSEKILQKEVYSCLYSAELKNIIFIVKDHMPHTVALILNDETFTGVLGFLQANCKNVSFSEQDKKINGYAAAIVDKLREGIETGIIDKPQQQQIKYCPMCGMECDPSIPYCMECGTEV